MLDAPTRSPFLDLLAAKREQHPELRRALTWRGIERICTREGVLLVVRAHSEAAQLVGYDGTWSILVNANLPLRRHAYYAAHELAHLWLHVDAADGRGAMVFNFSGYAGDDPREDDAEALATLMLGGPRFSRYF